MISKIYRFFCIGLLALVSGCYPDEADYIEELDLVYTNHAPSFDFKSKRTFAIPDSVVKITGDNVDDPDGNGKPQFAKSTYSTAIITSLKQQMQANGWQLVDKGSNPDVLLLPTTMTTTNIYYYYDWRIGNSKFSLHPGIGFGLEKYGFNNDRTLGYIAGSSSDFDSLKMIPAMDVVPLASGIKKTSLHTNYFDIPDRKSVV